MATQQAVLAVLKHIAACRTRLTQPLLETIYGPQAKVLRTRVAALLLGRKVTGSDPAAQYGNLRVALLHAVGVNKPACTAALDAEFELVAQKLLWYGAQPTLTDECVAAGTDWPSNADKTDIAEAFGLYDPR